MVGMTQCLLTTMLVPFPAFVACMECFLLVATSYEYLDVCMTLLSARLVSCKGCLQKATAPC